MLGVFHPDYVWHEFAQVWQTPGAGEEQVDQPLAMPLEERVARFEDIGIPRGTAERLVDANDTEMARCVLALYRSAAQPAMVEWGRELGPAASRPGLAIIAPLDPYVGATDLASEIAAELRAHDVELEGQGHWWMLGDPAQGAAVLDAFWRSVP